MSCYTAALIFCPTAPISQASSLQQVALNLLDSDGGGEQVAKEVVKLIYLVLI